LHGDEGPAFCAEVHRRTGARVIKAAQLRGEGDVRQLERFHTDFHLADAAAPGQRGGSGRTFDWSLLKRRRSAVPLILSGGLHAGNVGDALARVHPYALDTASGTEAAPGRKDPDKLRAFFAAARAAVAAPAPA
jgi:phosphoribosylanthranilate isomerase